jgi:hypothetical protein
LHFRKWFRFSQKASEKDLNLGRTARRELFTKIFQNIERNIEFADGLLGENIGFEAK